MRLSYFCVGLILNLTGPAYGATRSDQPALLDSNMSQTPIGLPSDPFSETITPARNAPVQVGTEKQPRGDIRHLTGNPLWSIPLNILSATRERPVFSSTRRPPPRAVAVAPIPQSVPAPPPTPAPPEVPHLSLVGTVGNGDQSIAVFVDQSSRNVVRLKIGEAHLGWVLRVVRGRETALEKHDSTVLITFPPPGAVPSIVSEQAAYSGGSGVLPGLGPVNQTRAPTIAPQIAPLPPPVSGRVPGL